MKYPKKFILFCGSYSYKPNQQAIDFIIKKIIPIISLKNISLIITGHSSVDFKNANVFNLGLVSKNELKFLYNNCICLFVPIFEGYGTRIKILEGLVLGSHILTTSKGIEAMNLTHYRIPFWQMLDECDIFFLGTVKSYEFNPTRAYSTRCFAHCFVYYNF